VSPYGVAGHVIASFRSKALQRFWWNGNARGLPAAQIDRLTILLSALDAATLPTDMNVPGFRFHKLTGDQKGRYSVRVTGNWRVTFGWSSDGPDAVAVDHEDYH
jgi:toxin HigB-1